MGVSIGLESRRSLEVEDLSYTLIGSEISQLQNEQLLGPINNSKCQGPSWRTLDVACE